MAQLDYNAENHEPMQDFTPVPAGNYVAWIISSEMKDTNAGDGQYLQLEWEIIQGEFKGRYLYSRLNIDNPNKKAEEIALRELSSVCRAVGKLRVADSVELHQVPCSLKVILEPRKDKPGENNNAIKGYKSVNESTTAGASSDDSSEKSADKSAPPWKKK